MLFDVASLNAAVDVPTVLACVKFPPPLKTKRYGDKRLHRLSGSCPRLEDYQFTVTRAGAEDATAKDAGSWLQRLTPTEPAHLLRPQHQLYETARALIRKHALYVAAYRRSVQTKPDEGKADHRAETLARASTPSVFVVWGPVGSGKRAALRLAAQAQHKLVAELDGDELDVSELHIRLRTANSVLLLHDPSPQILRFLREEAGAAFNSMLFVLMQDDPWAEKTLPKLQLDAVTFWPESSQSGWRKNRELVKVLARRLAAVWEAEAPTARLISRITSYIRTQLDCFPDIRRLLVHGEFEHGAEYRAVQQQLPRPLPRRLPVSDKQIFRAVFCASDPKPAARESAVRETLRLVDAVGGSLERVVQLNALATSRADWVLTDVSMDETSFLERASSLLDSLCDLDLVPLAQPEAQDCFRVSVHARASALAVTAGLAPQVFHERQFCATFQPARKPLSLRQLELRRHVGLETFSALQ
jgi:hypothetical protein